ncbi:MAG: hypothetical protein JWQ20_3996 [Conexibacter sp.]|nr:hypothetical protein [Conexibacter sp.]
MTHRLARRRAAGALAAAAAAAVALPASPASAAPPAPHTLRADVQITKFVATRAGLSALGTASATLAGNDARKRVTFSVNKGSTCSILTLNLQQLQLKLLGLNLDTSAINLRITGETSRTLGALFCRLAKSLKLGSASAARATAATLNRHLHGRPLHAIRISSRLPVVTADAAQAPPAAPGCAVLDLVLGPLNLDLLGLVVDLYGPDKSKPVEVHVTADPAAGVLGAVFCKLANGQAAG